MKQHGTYDVKEHKGETMEMKSKLYLRPILLVNYMRQENLFVYIE